MAMMTGRRLPPAQAPPAATGQRGADTVASQQNAVMQSLGGNGEFGMQGGRPRTAGNPADDFMSHALGVMPGGAPPPATIGSGGDFGVGNFAPPPWPPAGGGFQTGNSEPPRWPPQGGGGFQTGNFEPPQYSAGGDPGNQLGNFEPPQFSLKPPMGGGPSGIHTPPMIPPTNPMQPPMQQDMSPEAMALQAMQQRTGPGGAGGLTPPTFQTAQASASASGYHTPNFSTAGLSARGGFNDDRGDDPGGAGDVTGGGGLPSPTPPATTPPPAPIDPGSSIPFPGPQQRTPPPAAPPPVTPPPAAPGVPGRTRTAAPPPAGTPPVVPQHPGPDATPDQMRDYYASFPGFQSLTTQDWQDYYNTQQMPTEKGVDLVDFLMHTRGDKFGPEAQAEWQRRTAARGYDTYTETAPGVARDRAQTPQAGYHPGNPSGNGQNVIGVPGTPAVRGDGVARNPYTGQPIVPPAPPAAGTPPAPGAGAAPPPASGGATPPPAPPAAGAPPALPPPAPLPPVSGGSPESTALDSFKQALATQKSQGQAELARQVKASMAFDGSINAPGAVASSLGTTLSQYGADFDKQSTAAMLAEDQSAKDRALQEALAKYQQQTQLGVAGMDLEGKKYGADSSLTGQKYGVDANVGMSTSRNATDLQIAQIQAQAQAQAAASQAGAAMAASGASAAAQKYAADMAYKESMDRNTTTQQGNQLQYNLGVLGINRDIYGIDSNSQNSMYNLLYQMGPEQLARYVFGVQNPNGPVYVQP